MSLPTPAGRTDARLLAIGAHVPPRRVSNLELIAAHGIEREFLERKLGVVERAIKADGETTSDLCVRAYGDLRAAMPIEPAAIQLVCVVTQNPDLKIPHTAAILHQRLELARHCMSFDISQGCAGYVHGLAIVAGLLERFDLEHALLFTCDPYSTIVDPRDRNTALLFGDAATVSYVARPPAGGGGYALADAVFGTAPGPAAGLRCDRVFEMDGRGVVLHAAREVPRSVRALLDRCARTADDIDLFLFHPGSKHIVDVLRRDLGLAEAKVPFESARYGNTVSSSIPLLLRRHLARREASRILLGGFGVGFSWGSCLLERRP